MFDGGRIFGLGGEAVFWKDHNGMGACSQFPDQFIVGVEIAEYPSGAVDVENNVGGISDLFRGNDVNADLPPSAGIDHRMGDGCGVLMDGCILCGVQDSESAFRRKLKNKRWFTIFKADLFSRLFQWYTFLHSEFTFLSQQ